jgi:hypothetical protein
MLLSFILLLICKAIADGLPTLALCLTSRNEMADLAEWLAYHKSIGVTKVILTDNSNSQPFTSEVEAHLKSGFLMETAFPADGNHPNQFGAYRYCWKHFGSQYTFIGFMDVDEFIVVKDTSKSVTDVLKDYQGIGGLTLNWMNFNSNGHYQRPSGGILPNYSKCFRDYHVKTIVEAKYVKNCLNPHYCSYQGGYKAVDTNKNPVPAAYNPSNATTPDETLFQTIYLNHYAVKSYEDFRSQMTPTADGSARWKKVKDAAYFYAIEAKPTQTCDVLKMGTF